MADPVSLEGMPPQEIANLAALSLTLMRNPATKKDFQRAVKKAVPDFSAPEIEAEDAIEAATKPLREKTQKLEEQLQMAAANKRLEELRAEAVANGASAEEMRDGSFEKWAQEKGFGITQLPQAARFRTMERQLAAPTPSETSFSSGGMTTDDLKAMRKEGSLKFGERVMHEEFNKLKQRRPMAGA